MQKKHQKQQRTTDLIRIALDAYVISSYFQNPPEASPGWKSLPSQLSHIISDFVTTTAWLGHLPERTPTTKRKQAGGKSQARIYLCIAVPFGPQRDAYLLHTVRHTWEMARAVIS